MNNLSEILTLEDFVLGAAFDSYDGRIRYTLETILSEADYSYFDELCNEEYIKVFTLLFEDRIKINLKPFSSNSNDHFIEIDGRRITLVGGKDGFYNQFTQELRDKKIDNLLE